MGGELLRQRLHAGVPVGVQLPAGDAQVETQPGGAAGAAAGPDGVLEALLTVTQPGGERVREWEGEGEGEGGVTKVSA